MSATICRTQGKDYIAADAAAALTLMLRPSANATHKMPVLNQPASTKAILVRQAKRAKHWRMKISGGGSKLVTPMLLPYIGSCVGAKHERDYLSDSGKRLHPLMLRPSANATHKMPVLNQPAPTKAISFSPSPHAGRGLGGGVHPWNLQSRNLCLKMPDINKPAPMWCGVGYAIANPPYR
jgi:hypothetical protein